MGWLLFYSGSSMHPTFQAGDVLRVEPCPFEAVAPGEVVIFRDPRLGGQVVHRVVARVPEGLLTQGDNCPQPDDPPIRPGDFLGKVVACERRGRLVPLASASPRRRWRRQAWQMLAHGLGQLLQPIYLRWTGRLAGWLTFRILCFPRPEGPEWQLWWGRILVGRRFPAASTWTIRRPFHLFLDETRLPLLPPQDPARKK